MSYLANLPSLMAVFAAYPELARPLLDLGEAIMRSPAPLSAGERELLAAYVSALNGCKFCQESHESCAVRFGQAAGQAARLVTDFESVTLSNPKLQPILHYARKLTAAPATATQEDIDAILAAGWQEAAIVYANLVCGFFGQLNRLVEGLGIPADAQASLLAGRALHEGGYPSVGPQ